MQQKQPTESAKKSRMFTQLVIITRNERERSKDVRNGDAATDEFIAALARKIKNGRVSDVALGLQSFGLGVG